MIKIKLVKSLIVGVNSFLGRELCQQLLKNEGEVIGVYHHNKNNLLKQTTNIPISEMFILDTKIDVVYLISAYVPSKNDINIEDRLNDVNVEFVKQVCHKFKNSKIVYCSTVSVYKKIEGVVTEKSELLPSSLYGKSKLMGEKIVKSQNKYAIVRISSMFGEGMKKTTFLPAIINNALQNNAINLLGDGGRYQNYISVKEVAKYLMLSSLKGNNVYLATDIKSYSNKEVALLIKKELDHIAITYSGIDNSESFQYDNSFTRKELKINENINFTESLKELIKWQQKKF